MVGKLLKKLSLLSLIILVAGCQVNPKSGPAQPLVEETTPSTLLPLLFHPLGKELGVRKAGEKFQALRNDSVVPGLFLLKSGKVIHVSNLNLQPGKENIVVINAADFALIPLPAEKLLRVESNMPTMPEMGGPFPAILLKKSASEIEATIDIAHGGYWDLLLEFDGLPKESVHIGIDIPKGRGK